MKNIRIFYLKIFIFLVVKFSVYLNRHAFVMDLQLYMVFVVIKCLVFYYMLSIEYMC